MKRKQSKPMQGNMLIAQSGGPTMVINQTLVGAVLEARRHACIGKIYGSLHGIQGILDQKFIDLTKESEVNLHAVAQTPSSALGTVRRKPGDVDCAAMFATMQRHDIRYFFYIGGNDSAETAHIIDRFARQARYELHCFHLCKTIDNDLRANDHTPGYGSAARFVAMAFMGDNLDNRALPGVKINVIMGRHAGFLTAASALARVYEDDGPHLIYLPERPFDEQQFVQDAKRVVEKLGRCLMAVSEGIVDSRGTPVAAKFSREVDSHGNAQLSGTGALGDLLAGLLKERAGFQRVRADTFGYLQRSFPEMISESDAREAFAVGRHGVRFAVGGQRAGSVAIVRKPGARYAVDYRSVPLKNVARDTRHMPAAFINAAGNDVTKAFLDYAKPLVGRLPRIGRLKGRPVRRRVT